MRSTGSFGKVGAAGTAAENPSAATQRPRSHHAETERDTRCAFI
jgi:hypothetical protein